MHELNWSKLNPSCMVEVLINSPASFDFKPHFYPFTVDFAGALYVELYIQF